MKKSVTGLLAGSAVLALGLTTVPAHAVPADGTPSRSGASTSRPHDLPNPFAAKQQRLRKQAVELIVNGKAQAKPQRGGGSVVTLANGAAVEFPDAKKEARIWTILSEFGSESSGRYGRGAGPVHDQISPPDRTTDNSTQWTNDFEVPHYDEMFNGEGESFRNYYLRQSNGQYHTTVTTEDWVTVPKNGRWYGDNANETQGYWTFIADTVNAWYAEASKTMSAGEIDAYLSQFDVWDRYDHDGDKDFNEPDGYIDHFQAIHAGEGEEAGGGALGEDAIWSHRWYADYTTQGSAGPEGNLLGGKQIGQSKYWVGDYTVEPENGGLGVFAHEYGHDLGLPDFYDTAGGENGSAFWTLMSSGSWLGHGEEAEGFEVGIGGTPNDMGPEEKLFLGWLNPQIVERGTANSSHTLRPAGDAASNDAVVVPLPDAVDEKKLTTPYAGDRAWYSGSRSDLTATLARQVPAASRVVVSAKAWYNTEVGYDYWWAEYRPVGASSWTRIGQAIDGASRGWTSETFSYRPGGQQTEFRFVYKSDGGVNEAGVFLDEIVTKVGQTVLDTDGAESASSVWTPTEFTRSDGTATTTGARYYLMENRTYTGYDDTLRTGPYNFREAITRPNWVEHFPYQDGLLVWMVNHSVPDNNTSEHAGTAYALPIDATPAALTWSDGSVARSRIQVFDATFGIQPTDAFTLTRETAAGVFQTMTAPTRPGVATFDDTLDYYNETQLPGTSVETAKAGVVATVTSQTTNGNITLTVTNPAATTP